MWPFKKKVVVTPIRWDVPKEHQELTCILWDELCNVEGSCAAKRLRFWNHVSGIMPKELRGQLTIKFDHQLPYIEVTPRDKNENKN